jgi:hypothetical protein
MKKYIFTESQLKKVISNVVNEQTTTKGKCVESSFKNVIVQDNNPQTVNKIKSNKFKVIDIQGTVNLNGKPYNQSSLKNTVIITPETTINVCIGSSLVISGAGFREAGIVHNEKGVMFIPQVN